MLTGGLMMFEEDMLEVLLCILPLTVSHESTPFPGCKPYVFASTR